MITESKLVFDENNEEINMTEEAFQNRSHGKFILRVFKDRVMVDDGALGYDIPRSGLKDSKHLLNWIHHICEKMWVDAKDIRELIEFAAEDNDMKYHL